MVLTTPVLRAIKEQLKAEVHVVTKHVFLEVLAHNPNVDKIHVLSGGLSELIPALKQEKFDLVVDLHNNLRSLRLKLRLRRPSVSFNKINLRKFLAVRFKLRRVLPEKHIVDRYFDALASLGVVNDGKGLDYYLSSEEEVDTAAQFFKGNKKSFIALVIGGSYTTKKIPFNKLVQICDRATLPVVLLGGKEDKETANELRKLFPHLINCSGLFSIGQSASVISQAEWVITSDTGLMHIAAAFNKKIISVWGNTIPEFGMYPYRPHDYNLILEVKSLSCRPCSKLGYRRCPRGHFRCMQDIDYEFVKELK